MLMHPKDPEMLFLQQLREHNKAAMQQLIDQYHGPLYYFTLLLTENNEIAKVVVKKTVITAMDKIHTYDPAECSIWIWLIRVMIPHLDISHTEILKRALLLMKSSQ